MFPGIELDALCFNNRDTLDMYQLAARKCREFVDLHANVLPLRSIRTLQVSECGEGCLFSRAYVRIQCHGTGGDNAAHVDFVQPTSDDALEAILRRLNNSFIAEVRLSCGFYYRLFDYISCDDAERPTTADPVADYSAKSAISAEKLVLMCINCQEETRVFDRISIGAFAEALGIRSLEVLLYRELKPGLVSSVFDLYGHRALQSSVPRLALWVTPVALNFDVIRRAFETPGIRYCTVGFDSSPALLPLLDECIQNIISDTEAPAARTVLILSLHSTMAQSDLPDNYPVPVPDVCLPEKKTLVDPPTFTELFPSGFLTDILPTRKFDLYSLRGPQGNFRLDVSVGLAMRTYDGARGPEVQTHHAYFMQLL